MNDQLISIDTGALREVVGGEACKQVGPGNWQRHLGTRTPGGLASGAIAWFATRAACRAFASKL